MPSIGDVVKILSDLTGFLFVVFLIVISWYLRKEIRGVLGRFTRLAIEKGDVKVSVDQEPERSKAGEPAPEQSPPIRRNSTEPEKSIQEAVETVEAVESQSSAPEDWMSQIESLVQSKDYEKAERLLASLRDSTSDLEERARFEGYYYFTRYSFGDQTALGKLREVAERVKNDSPAALGNVQALIGAAYEKAGDSPNAIRAYEEAARLASKEDVKALRIVSIAKCLLLAGQKQQALIRLMESIEVAKSPEALSALYQAISHVYDQDKNYDLSAIALEKAVQMEPNNTVLRFYTAYGYGETKLSGLALLHYDTMLGFAPDDHSALNNIGVALGELGLPVLSVNRFKAASDLGNTLASANLAQQYLRGGFVEEASAIVEKAKEQKEIHENVGGVMAAISKSQTDEIKAKEKVVATAREQQQVLISFAEAFFTHSSDPYTFGGNWRLEPEIEASSTHVGDKVVLMWTTNETIYRIEANQQNRGAHITSFKTVDDYYPKTLADHGYMYLSADSTELTVLTFQIEYNNYSRSRSVTHSCRRFKRVMQSPDDRT